MSKLKIAILGASGIGKYHAREYKNAGCEVVAILGSSKEKAINTSNVLKKEFGIQANSYYELETLLENEELDAVSICVPSELHSKHVRICLENDLHVLCEKPFIYNHSISYPEAKNLCSFARLKGKILTVNTQWPSVFSKIKDYYGKEKIKKFFISMEPSGIARENLIIECIPHFNSMLLKLFNKIKPKNINFSSGKDYERINFNYLNNKEKCKIEYLFKKRDIKPSKISFSINNHHFYREIKGDNKQYLVYNGKESFEIEDPLKVSIRSFVNAVNKQSQPLISETEALENVRLQDILLKKIK